MTKTADKAENGSPIPKVGDKVRFYTNKQCTTRSVHHANYDADYFIVQAVDDLYDLTAVRVRLSTPEGRVAGYKRFGQNCYLVILDNEEERNTL